MHTDKIKLNLAFATLICQLSASALDGRIFPEQIFVRDAMINALRWVLREIERVVGPSNDNRITNCA